MAYILIIDDDPGIQEALKAILEFDGHQVAIGLDENSLFELAENKMPDLILLDLLLSGKDGKVVAKNLKRNLKTKKIPIIMLSAHPSAKETAKLSGADDFLAKPFNMEELLKLVNRYTLNV